MKYIVIEITTGSIKQEMPFIFPNHLVHKDVAKNMQSFLNREHQWSDTRVVSAGEISPFGVECYGKSSTLGVESRKYEDSRLIQFHDYGIGIKD